MCPGCLIGAPGEVVYACPSPGTWLVWLRVKGMSPVPGASSALPGETCMLPITVAFSIQWVKVN